MSFKMDIAWGQIQGARAYQQDSATSVSWPDNRHLLLLADGMGGHVAGDIASTLVIENLRDTFIASDEPEESERLLAGLRGANVALFDRTRTEPSLRGMGTTVIACSVVDYSLYWVSVGDSPLWLFRKGVGRRLNQDHSMAAVLDQQAAAGGISAEEAARSPRRSQLLEAVMGLEIKLIDAPVMPLPMQVEDVVILASDGVETCSLAQLEQLVGGHEGSAEDLVGIVLDAVEAYDLTYQDNATVVILRMWE